MKKGFTLMELLVVIVIVSVVSIGATISFSQIDDDTSRKESQNKFKEIQRAANLYLDLHNSSLEAFIYKASNGEKTFVSLSQLKAENYITDDLIDPLTGNEISINDSVVLYLEKVGNKEYVNSCIVNRISETDIQCIANNKGNQCECCNYTINDNNPAC